MMKGKRRGYGKDGLQLGQRRGERGLTEVGSSWGSRGGERELTEMGSSWGSDLTESSKTLPDGDGLQLGPRSDGELEDVA